LALLHLLHAFLALIELALTPPQGQSKRSDCLGGICGFFHVGIHGGSSTPFHGHIDVGYIPNESLLARGIPRPKSPKPAAKHSGAHAPSRAVAGALAGHIFQLHTVRTSEPWANGQEKAC
jgi:hypothetical protein